MPNRTPTAAIDQDYSSPGAAPRSWDEAGRILDEAKIFWLSTVRPDGRPHVTPLIAVWLDGALHFCTGETERKGKNLAANPRCILTTGCNEYDRGLDVVLEGTAVAVEEQARLQAIADRYKSKYGWDFTPRDGRLHGGEGNVAIVYAVAPEVVFGFGKGETFSQTRWRF
jgi:general stress protein 26